MQNSNSKLWGALVVVAIIAVGGYFFPHAAEIVSSTFGASTPGTRYPHGITVGNAANSPTNLADVKVGTGALVVSAGAGGTVTASSSAVFDIAVTGVVTGDLVTSVVFATTTAPSPQWGATSPNWLITSAKASTTAGFITVTVLNQTGGSASISASGIASSTVYTVVKTQ